MSNVNELAEEIHHRRAGQSPEASLDVAVGEAHLFIRYGVEPLLDHFQGSDMTLALPDQYGRTTTVLRATDGCARFSPLRCEDADVLVFCEEDEHKEVGLIGWLPSEFAREAVEISLGSNSAGLEVKRPFLLPMPEEFDFETPETDKLIKIWSFHDNGWWTSGGFFLYERKAPERLEGFGQQLAG